MQPADPHAQRQFVLTTKECLYLGSSRAVAKASVWWGEEEKSRGERGLRLYSCLESDNTTSASLAALCFHFCGFLIGTVGLGRLSE